MLEIISSHPHMPCLTETLRGPLPLKRRYSALLSIGSRILVGLHFLQVGPLRLKRPGSLKWEPSSSWCRSIRNFVRVTKEFNSPCLFLPDTHTHSWRRKLSPSLLSRSDHLSLSKLSNFTLPWGQPEGSKYCKILFLGRERGTSLRPQVHTLCFNPTSSREPTWVHTPLVLSWGMWGD
jgi:hypothetical protein